MRDYGQIQTAFWTSPEVQSFSDQGKLLAAYLLTGPHSNGLGCYRLPDGYVMADFGWTPERVSKGFGELFQTGFCNRCKSTLFVVIPNFLKWNPISNGNVAAARIKEFESIPRDSSIYKELCYYLLLNGNHLPNPFINRLETLSKGYAKQEPNRTEPTHSLTGADPEPEPDPNQPEPKQSADALIFLDGLNIAAWEKYVAYRRTKKTPKLKPQSVAQQQRWLTEQGSPELQDEIINNTIRNGWTGLFELQQNGNGKNKNKNETPAEHKARVLKSMEKMQ